MRKISQRPITIPSTSSTLSRHPNPRLPQTRIHQLPPVRLPKIQPHLPRIPKPKQRIPIPKFLLKIPPNLFPNHIAASPDTRPHRRHHVLHPRSILLPHLRHTPLNDPRHRPSPSRMKRRHHSLLHIHHQHRNAIRRPHPQQNSRHIGHQSIPLQHRLPLRRLQSPLQRPVPRPNYPHHTGMNLPHSHQHCTTIVPTNTTQKPTPILRH